MAEERFVLEEEEEEDGANWLDSYSDLVTDLMAIFVVLFSFAMMSASQQSAALKAEREALAQSAGAGQQVTVEAIEAQNDLDMIYHAIKEKIAQSDYSEGIDLERGDGYITFKFRDSVLFYPDSPVMRTDSSDILEYIGELLIGIQDNIATVEISGHTAKVSESEDANIIAWDLSSSRAIAVLKFFVDECSMPESKMAVAGYAHYHPVASNDTEEGRAQNRRVEIKISRKNY